MNYPKKILLREDGPREGFQSLSQIVSTADKLNLIKMLAAAGANSIEVSSFVRPDRVPQHADAEEVAKGLTKNSKIRFRALYLNPKGLERAAACPALEPEGYLMTAASETFLKRNNNKTILEAENDIPSWIEIFKTHNLKTERLMLSCAFGDSDEGRIPIEKTLAVAKSSILKLESLGIKLPELTFADTTGYANPESVKCLVQEFQSSWPDIAVGLHLHDTRGSGMANALAGLQCGVSRFDASVGGLGGCPFTKGGAGNIPTEDLAFLCSELGIETTINLELYAEAARYAEQLAQKPLPGKYKQGGPL